MYPSRRYLPLLLSLGLGSMVHADVPVIPRPVLEKDGTGAELMDFKSLKPALPFDFAWPVEAPGSLQNEKALLEDFFTRDLGSRKGTAIGAAKGFVLSLSIDESLPREGYRLVIDKDGMRITGGSAAGVFYGIQTFKQMAIVQRSKGHHSLPAMVIEDAPVCEWRGAMLDTARHYMPKEFIKKFIDVIALYKMNRLHWHLVDSEAWRLEIKKYPKLVEVAEGFPTEYPSEDPTNKSRPARFMYGDFHGGGYFTQEDVREIVAYAKARHVEIMPEIEFPGHAMAALTAYPEFGTTGKVPTVKSNHSPDLIAPNEKGIGFVKDVLDETMELFPFDMIHFGGDEAPKVQWKESAEVQAKIKELGLKDENQLQAWMFNELAAHIKKKGKRPVGWEEIMHDHNLETLTKDAVVTPWLSAANAIKSANAGLGVIHSQTGVFYLDSWQTNSPADNWTLYRGPLTLKRIYDFNLFPEGLTDEGKKNIYGATGYLWSELMTKPEHVEYQGFPRLTAIAELTWTPDARKDYDDYYERLVDHTAVLDAYKVNYRYIDPLPSGTWSAGELKRDSFDIELNDRMVAQAAGEMVVSLDYTGGASGLEIKKVQLLQNGKVLATDEHDGFTGSKSQDNTYRLKFDERQKGPFSLRVTHANRDGKQGSEGKVTVFTGKGLELFDPRNFAGGDYPSASWTTGDTKSPVSSIRIPMDGIVLKAGPHELIVDLKQAKAPVKVGRAKVMGSGKTGSMFTETATLDDTSTIAILPMDIKQSDLKAGYSIILEVKSPQPSSGDVRVRATRDLPKDGEGLFAWKPELFDTGLIIAYARGVKATKDGAMKIQFNFKGGSHGLDINSVQLIRDGAVIAQSSRKGFAGGQPRDNVYMLESPQIKAGGSYNLRVSMSGSGGTNTSGQIAVE